MGLIITAEFALGTYQGRSPTGAPEPFPEVDRLFAAFTAAAGASPYADMHGSALRITDRHRAALEWMESNAPDKISMPDYRFNVPNVTAYRVTGLRSKTTYASPASRDALARASLAGPLYWCWLVAPDREIVGALEELASEVAYLGEANSPVVVRVSGEEIPAGNALSKVLETELFPIGAVPISTPAPGRLRKLEASHESHLAKGRGEDGPPPASEQELQAPWSSEGVRLLWYRQEEQQDATDGVPWIGAIVVEAQAAEEGTQWPPRPENRVAWAVALHRALARALDPDAPPLVTGHGPPDQRLPANRLAIQTISREDPVSWDHSVGVDGSFVLLIPRDASAEDQATVMRGLQAVAGRSVYMGRLGSLMLGRVRFIEAIEFWRSPVPGYKRLYVPRPLVIAETRAQNKVNDRAWGLEDAALLSIGMVWRDLLEIEGKGERFYRDLVEAARSMARIHKPRQVVGQDLVKFVHRVNPSNVLTAFTAFFEFKKEVVESRAPVAIGQARHLGNGLLVPVDLPASLFSEDGELSWV